MQASTLLAAALATLVLATKLYAQEGLPQPEATGQAAGAPRAPAATADPKTYRQQTSYVLGRNFAANLRESEIECDLEFLFAGIRDVLESAQPRWSDEQLQATMQQFEQEMQQKAQARIERMAAKNKQEADAFLAENARREGVETTASGLQYRVIRQGNGASPTVGDSVRCNYRGTLLDGTEFDNSARYGGPAEFQIAPGLIRGWIEALQKMKVGDKWQLFVPPNLAYGVDSPGPPIEPNSMLVFEIELLEIVQQ
ncbi:MAG TPA: FKBP-type peptidyl-prolyl cis-trans isomerase [Pirellulales bacterium]|nr:FKBP-type peptidyl-prolyl cis-trans isomerase [Pirellulales bacterium]